MAPDRAEVLSFDEIIQRDREERDRKTYQDLANDIFGKGKKDRTQQNGNRKTPTGPSLASRVGISKRSLSKTARPRTLPTSPANGAASPAENRNPRIPRTARQNSMTDKTKQDLLSEALIAKGATNHARPRPAGPEINIKGSAGPYVVVASNFAPGTTAADIESAMVPNGSEILSCRIVTASPTVIAEMMFNERKIAEGVIETFNNKKADGRILHVYMKSGGPSPIVNAPEARNVQSVPQLDTVDLTQTDILSPDDRSRDASDRSRRRADPQLQDGRYGFAKKEDQMDVDTDEPAPLRREPEQHSERRDGYQDNRYQRDERYNAAPRDYSRNGYYDRGWGGPRPRDNRRLYSDSQFPRYPARGYR